MRRAIVAALAASAGVITAVGLTAQPGRAATALVVNSTADSGGTCPGASCTLRAAIAVANTPGSTPTAITFGAGTNGTPIALTSGQMEIMTAAGTVTVTGNGPGNTIINANGQTNRIFQVDAGANVSLTQITLENGTIPVPIGNGGGAILISGSGTLSVNNSAFTNNNGGIQLGGGIFNFGGTLTVLNSTFSGNTSGDGGAIGALGTTTIANTTMSGNHASGEGGGFFSNSASSPVSIVNSTIANNTTGGDGGGIAVETGTTQVTNSIVAKNTAAVAPNCFLGDTGIIGDGGNNLEDGTAPGTCAFATNAVHADPALGTLQNNGGPTSTLAITNTSPAFDAASTSVCNASPISGVDQRGDSRVSEATGDTKCDIGAFEVQGATTTPTPSPTALPTPPTGSGAAIGGDMTGIVIGGIGVTMLAGLALAISRRRT